MRLLDAAALAAAALLLAPVASAQGLGDAAAQQKQKRQGGKPAKVFTDSDLSTASTPAAPELPAAASGDAAATGEAGKTAKPKTEAELEAEAEQARQKAIEDWRGRLDETRRQEQELRGLIDRIQLDLNDTSGLYGPGRARSVARLEEAQKKLAELQAKLVDLEAEGRRSNYR